MHDGLGCGGERRGVVYGQHEKEKVDRERIVQAGVACGPDGENEPKGKDESQEG